MVSPWVQISCAITWCLLSAGICFGFAAIKPVLVAEGVYADLCPVAGGGGPAAPCLEQDLQLNFMWTVAAGSTNAVSLLVGAVLDHRGPRTCGFVGVALLAAGALLLSEQPRAEWLDPFLVGYTVLALGGPFVFISTFQLANAVPDHSGKVLAAITGAFDTSSALFLFYRLLYQRAQHTQHTVPLRVFFRLYLVVPAFILVCQLFLMPRESYVAGAGKPTTAELAETIEDTTEHDHLLDQHVENFSSFGRIGGNQGGVAAGTSAFSIVGSVPEDARWAAPGTSTGGARRGSSYLVDVPENVTERLVRKTGGIFGILDGLSASEQIRTWWFGFILVMTCLCMLRINFFISTVGAQELYLVGPSGARIIGDLFDIALPAGGVVAIPFIGLLLDELTTFQVLQIMCSASVLTGFLGCLRSFWLNVVGMLVLVVYRPFYYSVTTELSAKVFGPITFGRLYGLIMTLSGVFNMLQAVLDRTLHGPLDGNPIPINALLTASTGVVAASLLWYTKHEGTRRLKELQMDDSEEEALARGPYGTV